MYKKLAIIAVAVSMLSGCAATQVAISKRTLDVQTKMTDTIFLDPVEPSERTVLVQVRNTSDKPDFDIAQDVKAAIAAKGYRVVEDPKKAHYILQANILQVGKTSPTAAESMFSGGFGASINAATTSALGGAMLAGALGTNGRDAMGAAMVFGIGETIAGAMVKDVYFSAITDLQVQERIEAGSQPADFKSKHTLKQGNSGSSEVNYAKKSDMQMYQTRIMSMANKVNLEFTEAAPELRQGLVRSISGMF